ESGEIYAVGLEGSVVRIAPAVRISPDTEAFDEIGGPGSVGVISPIGCPGWTALSNDPWIAIESGADGDGNGTVAYRVNANPDVPPRTGTMTIAGHTFHVDQAGGPAPMLSLDDASGPEGSGTVAAFTVTLSLASADTVLVDYVTAPDTASVLDFVPASGTISFDPGETTQPLEIQLQGDSLDEDDETFFVLLSTPVAAGIDDGEGTGTITDDDAPPSISIAGKSIAEGFGVRRVPLAVTLDSPSGRAIAVDYAIGPGSATPGADFRAESGTLQFDPGATRKTLFVWTKGDRADEPNETVIVDLAGAVNASIATPQATVILVDDDPAPRPRSVP
ncbi:MAG TPA: Calx-beta domain-containing protein, partial [Vicinamibacteria bacterium]|nr:Calx-beta domain-containing protein [Vicinamibacteria bacterium]